MTLYEEVRAALRETCFRPRKSLGQNFLIHERVIDSIVRLLDLVKDDRVVEIGPGLGFLTRRLMERAAEVWAVEIDAALVSRLKRSELGNAPNLRLIEGDILQIGLNDLIPSGKVKLAGNLPYSISTPVLFRIFEWRERLSSIVLMVQKEVADRMAAAPGTKDYGMLSVWCQAQGRVVKTLAVAPEAFFPKPKVRSSVLKIDLHPEPLVSEEEVPALRGLVRAAFGQRRKQLGNALVPWLERDRREIENFLCAEGIDPMRRGETLSVAEFIRLACAAKSRRLPTAGA